MAEAKVQKWRTRFCQFRCNLSNAQQFSWGYGAKSGSGSYFCNFVHSCPLQCHNVACLDVSLDLMLVILQANPCSFWSDLQPEQGQAPKSRGFTEFVCQRIGVPSWQHSTSTSCCLATPGLAPKNERSLHIHPGYAGSEATCSLVLWRKSGRRIQLQFLWNCKSSDVKR